MALRAATNLQHWREAQAPPETERVFVPANEEVPEDLYTDEELEELKASGAIIDDGDLQKEQDLRKQVEDLQRRLDEQRLELEAARARQTSPGTLYQTEAVREDNVDDLGEDSDPTPGNANPSTPVAEPAGGKVVREGKVQAPSKTDK